MKDRGSDDAMRYPPGLPGDVAKVIEGIARVIGYRFEMERRCEYGNWGGASGLHKQRMEFICMPGKHNELDALRRAEPIIGMMNFHGEEMKATAIIQAVISARDETRVGVEFGKIE